MPRPAPEPVSTGSSLPAAPGTLDGLSPAFPGRAPWGTADRLRAWQADALTHYLTLSRQDYLAVATPGAGKTTFALRVANELLHRRVVERIIVVCPTEHLKVQWAGAAARAGIHLDPGLGSSGKRARSREYDGLVLTYAGVATQVLGLAARCHGRRTLAILDEIHHAGDSRAWGDAVAEAFDPAVRRLALTGTPFRSDDHPIPFVAYETRSDGSRISRPDFSYGYADALRDHVVRPVLFMTYGGPMRWRTKAGDEIAANLSEALTVDLSAQAWRTALDPKGDWIPHVLSAADRRLTEVRRHVPDAGGLVIATNQAQARAYGRILNEISGVPPTVVVSETPRASRKIEQFTRSSDRWLVAVRMVSEGVDVPRLAVGVYATSTSTPLFFAQAVGRFVRARRRGELATVFLPTVPKLLAHASALERSRDHVLGRPRIADDLWAEEQSLLDEIRRERTVPDETGDFEALASAASFDHALFEGQQWGLHAEPTSQDEADYLGLPGLLEHGHVHSALADRQRRQVLRRQRDESRASAPPDAALHRRLGELRKSLHGLVGQYARIAGKPHSHVHAELRRHCGGPPVGQATTAEIEARITAVRTWLAA